MTVPPTGIRWISWQPGDGYGDAALGYVAALDALGVPVTWTLLEWRHGEPSPRPVERYDGPLAQLAERAIDHDTLVLHMRPGNHARWLAQGGHRRAVLYTTWETDGLPAGWAAAFDDFDAVLVPSTFNRAAFLAAGCRTEIHVVPHCARRVPEVEPARFDRIGDRFTFYTIATWSTRKAVPETVSAFLDAFNSSDDVALVVKTSADDQQAVARARRGLPSDGPPGWGTGTVAAFVSLLAGRRNVPEVHLIPVHIPRREVDALHARGDCFFSLTRSEGWGLSVADALLFGNPVVVTGWGGHLDYLGADYPLLVDYDLVPTMSDPPDDWFSGAPGQRWARARHDHAVDLLRWVAGNRDKAAAIGRRAGAELASTCAPEVIGRRLLDVLHPS